MLAETVQSAVVAARSDPTDDADAHDAQGLAVVERFVAELDDRRVALVDVDWRLVDLREGVELSRQQGQQSSTHLGLTAPEPG